MAEQAEVVERREKAPVERAADLALCEVARDAPAPVAPKLSLRVRGHEPLRLVVRAVQEVLDRHARLDARQGAFDAIAPDSMHDRERLLLARAREGDLDAFAEFVRLFERRVRAVLSRLLDDERDVDEAAQDTFVQAWRNLDRFRAEAAPFTWLYRIAVNEALQRTRRKRLDMRSLDDPAAGAVVEAGARHTARPADIEAGDHEALAFIAQRLRALPLESRAPLVLRDLEGWSYEDIAAALDLSVAAVKSRIHRARLEVARDYEAWQGESEAS